MDNSNQIKTKEQIQLEKRLNKSVRMLSKMTCADLGLVGIQEDDNILFLGDKQYLKVYSLKKPSLGDLKNQFIQRLTESMENRVRISIFHRNKNQKQSTYTFLSVYVNADTYVDAKNRYMEIDKMLIDNQCYGLGIGITNCKIDNLLTFIHMNCTGDMIQYNHENMMTRKDNWASYLFPEMEDMEIGKFKCGDRYGVCMTGKIIPFVKNDVNEMLFQKEGLIQIAMDLQKVQNEDEEMFRYELGKKYNSKMDESKFTLINMAYMVSYISEQKSQRDQVLGEMEKEFDDRGFLMMPGSGLEKEIFYSICSMGIKNYHVMRNTYPSIASSLLF